MCGLVGATDLHGMGHRALGCIDDATRTLIHRGPDGSAVYRSPTRQCVLGHTRLKVIDLHTGDQPLGTEDGSVQVVFNGEIYNYRQLRQELRQHGHKFRTESDTEVLLHGYREWGDELPARLNGMFAFAVWDQRATTLFLARDRAGQKPLFYYHHDGLFLFASEMKALLAFPDIDNTLDPSALPLYLSYGYVPSPGTLYSSIRKLGPGTQLTLDPDGCRESAFWSLDPTPKVISDAEALGAVRSLTRQAVQRRMESDVPLGAFLSGGVDSSVVVGLMSEYSEEPVSTFSIGFENQPDFDETRFARLVSNRFGTHHTEFHIGPGEIDLVDKLVDAYDEPFGDSSALPTYIVSQLTRGQVTVALTGDAADELFAGYHRLRAAQIADALPGPVATVGRWLSGLLPHDADFRSRSRRAKRFFAAAQASEAARTLQWMPYFGEHMGGLLRPELATALSTADYHDSLQDPLSRHRSQSSLARALAMNFETYLLDDLLVKADRCSMAHGLELRAPFLDPELIDFVATLPDHLKIRRGKLKYALKEAFKDLLPAEILTRPKWGFALPLSSWFRTHWRPLIEERLLAKDARVWQWLEPRQVRALAYAHFRGETDASHRLWTLLTLETWLRKGTFSLKG